MPLYGASESFIMKKKLYIIPLFLTLFSFAVIYLSLQLDTSPEMIVGDSMQARSFPIFLMVINLLLVGILSLQFYKTYPKEVELEKFPTWSSMLLFLIFYIVIFISGDMFVAIPIVMFLMGLTSFFVAFHSASNCKRFWHGFLVLRS